MFLLYAPFQGLLGEFLLILRISGILSDSKILADLITKRTELLAVMQQVENQNREQVAVTTRVNKIKAELVTLSAQLEKMKRERAQLEKELPALSEYLSLHTG